MKLTSLIAAAGIVVASAAAFAQTAPVAPKAPATTTTPSTAATPATTPTTKGVMKKPTTPEGIACSEQADAKGLHGKDRTKFRRKCISDMKAAAKKS
jgi:hypothetical protein